MMFYSSSNVGIKKAIFNLYIKTKICHYVINIVKRLCVKVHHKIQHMNNKYDFFGTIQSNTLRLFPSFHPVFQLIKFKFSLFTLSSNERYL